MGEQQGQASLVRRAGPPQSLLPTAPSHCVCHAGRTLETGGQLPPESKEQQGGGDQEEKLPHVRLTYVGFRIDAQCPGDSSSLISNPPKQYSPKLP
jgi:hypothetical protein